VIKRNGAQNLKVPNMIVTLNEEIEWVCRMKEIEDIDKDARTEEKMTEIMLRKRESIYYTEITWIWNK